MSIIDFFQQHPHVGSSIYYCNSAFNFQKNFPDPSEAPGRGAERLAAPGEAEEVAAAAAAAQHDRGTTGLGGRCRGSAWGGGGGGAVTWRNKDGWIDWTV